MTETNENYCRICLKRVKLVHITNSLSFLNFFIRVIRLKETSPQLWLCGWCRPALEKAIDLIKLAEESQEFLQSSKEVFHSRICTRDLYSFSYHKTEHIDIPPYINGYITNRCSEKTEVISEFVEENTELEQEFKYNVNVPMQEKFHEFEDPLKFKIEDNKVRKAVKKKLNYEEISFDVKILSAQEQRKEIEERVNSAKYRSMKYQCKYCGLGFLTVDVFNDHMLRHEKNAGDYECPTCHLRFKSKGTLTQHKLAHRRRFVCLLCSAAFSRWRDSRVHRSKCGTAPSPTVCCYCKKIFSDEHSLRVHTKGVHEREKKHVCKQCERVFSSKQKLTVHTRTHTGVKQFACSLCPRAFATNSNLRAHLSVHTTGKPHYCVECNTYYKTGKGLKRHFLESAKHSVKEKMAYSCTTCRKQFATQAALSSHERVGHAVHHCSLCDKNFSNNANLRKHVRCVHATEN